jgi:class 3 adenylate cyclase
MTGTAQLHPLTGHREFDGLIADFAELRDPAEIEAAQEQIWDRFGNEGAVFISDMASFSSTSRKSGVCHYLKMIHRARQVIGPVIADNDGLLLKCDADNTYAFFAKTADAIQASFDVNAAMFRANSLFGADEQVYLSVGIDYGRILLIGDIDFFGDPVNTASKLGEDLAVKAETLVTERALDRSHFEIPANAERMVARISDIEIRYVRMRMMEMRGDGG